MVDVKITLQIGDVNITTENAAQARQLLDMLVSGNIRELPQKAQPVAQPVFVPVKRKWRLHKSWTQEEDVRAMTLWNEGAKTKKIAREMGRSAGAIWAHMDELRRKGQAVARRERHTAEKITADTSYLDNAEPKKGFKPHWRMLFLKTPQCPKCSHYIQQREWGFICTTPECGFKISAAKYREIWDSMRRFAQKKNTAWTAEEDNELADLYNSGKKIKEIARTIGRTKGAVYARLDKLRAEGKVNGKRYTKHEQNPIGKTETAKVGAGAAAL